MGDDKYIIWDVACLGNNDNICYGFEVYNTHIAEKNGREDVEWFEIDAFQLVNIEVEQKIILNCIKKCEKCESATNVKRDSTINKIHRNNFPDVIIEQCNAGFGKTERLTDEARAKTKGENITYDVFISLFPQHSQKDEAIFKLQNKTSSDRTYKKDDESHTEIKEANLCLGKQIVLEGCIDGAMRYFGTIHSLTYTIYRLLWNDMPLFEDMATKIIENKEKLSEYFKCNKTIRYAQNTINVNSQVYIYCDEAQNMDVRYIFALFTLLKIFPNWRLKCTGDILQSTRNKYTNDNIFLQWKYNQEQLLSYWDLKIDYIALKPVFRRGKNPNVLKYINRLGLYQNYGLEPMEFSGQINDETEVKCTIESYWEDEDKNKYKDDEATINNVLDDVKECMKLRNSHPRDFLFIHPFIQNNSLFSELQSKLDRLFEEEYGYYNHTCIHKSEDSQPIDLNKSENKARFMSVHGSQGLSGRFTFVFGLSDKNLRYHCTSFDEIKGRSIVNVAITRSTDRMYMYIPFCEDSLTSLLLGTDNTNKKILHTKSISFIDVVNAVKIDTQVVDNFYKRLNTITSCTKLIDYSEHIAKFELIQAFFITQMHKQARDSNDEYFKNQIANQMNNIKKFKIRVEPSCQKYYKSRNSERKYDKKLKKHVFQERNFEISKEILLPVKNEIDLSGMKIKWHDVFFSFCNNVQELVQDNNLSYIFKEKEELCILKCFCIVYLLKWFNFTQINTAHEMQTFVSLYEYQNNNSEFYTDICGFRKIFRQVPSLKDSGWRTNWERSIKTRKNSFLSINHRCQLSYNNEKNKICIYWLRNKISSFEFENVLIQLSILGWLCTIMEIDENNDFPKIQNDTDIDFVFITLNLDTYKCINFSELRPILLQNRDNIIKKCCELLYSNIPYHYERYNSQSINSFIGELRKKEELGYTTKWSEVFGTNFRARKLSFEEFEKETKYSIDVNVSLFFNFEKDY